MPVQVAACGPRHHTDEDTCPDLSAVIVTNLGEARNAVIVWSADAVIAIGGSWGTLSEIALAKRRGDSPCWPAQRRYTVFPRLCCRGLRQGIVRCEWQTGS